MNDIQGEVGGEDKVDTPQMRLPYSIYIYLLKDTQQLVVIMYLLSSINNFLFLNVTQCEFHSFASLPPCLPDLGPHDQHVVARQVKDGCAFKLEEACDLLDRTQISNAPPRILALEHRVKSHITLCRFDAAYKVWAVGDQMATDF